MDPRHAKIWADVKANHLKLTACSYHEFEAVPGTEGLPFQRRFRCTRCGGEVDWNAYHWHQQGRRARP